MKKFRKLLAMGLAVMAAVSAMSMSAFAEIVTPLPGGGEFVIYEEGDVLPPGALLRTADFTFDQRFPAYPSSSLLNTPYTKNSVNNVIPLSSDERNIEFHFDESPSLCHVWVYNVDTESYELNGASMGMHANAHYSFRNLPAGTTYRFRFSGPEGESRVLSGSCNTY